MPVAVAPQAPTGPTATLGDGYGNSTASEVQLFVDQRLAIDDQQLRHRAVHGQREFHAGE